jgi:transcriptional regulator GlxA family with amidase domain
MKIAFVVFEGMTTLDFLGVYDPVTRLKTMGFRDDVEWDVCAISEQITDTTGQLTFRPNKIKPDLGEYDMFVVPGGSGVNAARNDPEFMDWIRTGHRASYKMSVCNGTMILGEAGYLSGKKATTNRNVFETLAPFVLEVIRERVVEDGELITAGGVSSSLDLGLYLVHKIAGPEVMEEIRAQMEYNGFEHAKIRSFGEPLKVA